MNVRLALAGLYVPRFVKRRELAQLLRRTSHAFGSECPDLYGQTVAERLRTFAAITTVEAERACRGDAGDRSDGGERSDVAIPVIASRLRSAASELGVELRRALRVATPAEAMKAARLLYRVLGIDFHGRADGTIVIHRCYFADWYTPRVCALMSALDEGVLVGLTGAGRLEFTRRITEGCDRCEATFHFDGVTDTKRVTSAAGSDRDRDGQA